MPTLAELDTGIARAIGFLRESQEPHALLWLEQMHRRFGIAGFSGSLDRFDELLSRRPREALSLSVFRRIGDPDHVVTYEELDTVTDSSDRIIVSALYCDQLDLPPSLPEVLTKAVRSGGYFCTHALLAWTWIQERGGRMTVPPGFVDELVAANAAIANDNPGSVTDLKLEAAAFLCLAGLGDRIDPAFVGTVVRTQNPDGGWGAVRDRPGVSDWHGSVLGLMLLLHARACFARTGHESRED